jgi:hypothetical protein
MSAVLNAGVRAYTSYAGVSRAKLRVVHGLLSGLWVCLSMAGFGIIVQNKRNSDFEHFTTYVAPHTAALPLLTIISEQVPRPRSLHLEPNTHTLQDSRSSGPGRALLLAAAGRGGHPQAVRPLQEQQGVCSIMLGLLSGQWPTSPSFTRAALPAVARAHGHPGVRQRRDDLPHWRQFPIGGRCVFLLAHNRL